MKTLNYTLCADYKQRQTYNEKIKPKLKKKNDLPIANIISIASRYLSQIIDLTLKLKNKYYNVIVLLHN